MPDHLATLWALHRDLKPRDARPAVRNQTLRARAAVDTAIAEVTTLYQLTGRHPGYRTTHRVDLDTALDDPDSTCYGRS